MPSIKKSVTTSIFIAFALSLLWIGSAAPCRAQSAPPLPETAHTLGTSSLSPTDASQPLATEQPAISEPSNPAPPQASAPSADDAWHFAVSPYIWFAGVHGTAVGPNDNGLGFRASPSDLLSHFRFGLLGAAQAQHKWLVVSMDLMWLRLEDTKAIPLPPDVGLGATSANIKATLFLLTPKVGVRVINQEKLKIDALTGLRYWYLGESLNFNPSALGLNFSGSQNFVDPLVGGRIELLLSPKVVVNILGDVGGWGTGSQLEYQVAGLLGYKIKPALTLQAGYRYLNVDKNGNHGIVFNSTMAGVVIGATLSLK